MLLVLWACSGTDSGTKLDADGDGHTAASDCDDTLPYVYPGAPELCDGVDDDCDGEVDEGVTVSGYADSDGDGYGSDGLSGCTVPTTTGGDCADDDAAVHPAAPERCNGVDDDCDGAVDEDQPAVYEDIDGDGFGGMAEDCSAAGVAVDGDCDDTDPGVYPGATEVCDGVDQDCDGETDEGVAPVVYGDADGDGWGGSQVEGCDAIGVATSGDCDDGAAGVHPGADELCDGVDDDCDGAVDEGMPPVAWAPDADGDGFGDAAGAVVACAAPGESWVADTGDCDDTDAAAWTGAPELCDGVDNDCDGTVDEGLLGTWYADADADGYGDPGVSQSLCAAPGAGWVTNPGDCDDTDAHAWTDAAEVCDGQDNDCDGLVDEDVVTTWYADADGDGHGTPAATLDTCAWPGAGWAATADDCDDAEPAVFPGNVEVCDGLDDDCEGTVDEGAADAAEWPEDADGDGFGAESATVWACTGVDNTLDCDDTEPHEPIVVDADGDESGDGSAAAPFPTIQLGLDTARACVVVYPGTYLENVDFGGADVRVEAVGSPLDTILHGVSGSAPTVTVASGETAAAIVGFTISGGRGSEEYSEVSGSCGSSSSCTVGTQRWLGGGVYVDGASLTLTEDVVANNRVPDIYQVVASHTYTYEVYGYGGGLYVADGTVTLDHVTFDRDRAAYGGDVYVAEGGTLTASHTRFLKGYASTAGGAVGVGGATARATLTNTLVVAGAAAEEGGGLDVTDGTATLTNTVLIGCASAGVGGGVAVAGAGSVVLTNSVVAYGSEGAGVYVDAGAALTVRYTDVVDNEPENWDGFGDPTGTDGNLCVAPGFRSWLGDRNDDDDDLRLADVSALVDAGDPTLTDADGTVSDIGAYGGSGSDW